MVEKRPRWGFWKCYDRLRLDGHPWNHKRVHRVYKAMKLNLPRPTKRRLPQRVQQPMIVEAWANAEWSMDFMSDTLYHGRRFRILNIPDEGVREVLDIVVDTSIPGGRVVRTLDRLVEWRGKPDAIRVDNGPEYLSQVFTNWWRCNPPVAAPSSRHSRAANARSRPGKTSPPRFTVCACRTRSAAGWFWTCSKNPTGSAPWSMTTPLMRHGPGFAPKKACTFAPRARRVW